MPTQYPCPKCANPLTKPELIETFTFVKDLDMTMDLLEGRLNTVICPLCQEKISLITAVLVFNPDEKTILALGHEDIEEMESQKFDDLAAKAGFSLKICYDYNEMRSVAIGWIDRYIVPIGPKIISGEIDELPLEKKVNLISPFFLRILKASTDYFLPPVWRISGGTPDKIRRISEDLSRSTLIDHMVRMRKLVLAQNRLKDLPSFIDDKIPKVCLTESVLSELAKRCEAHFDPKDDPQKFLSTYLDEYLCASAHACAGVANPRKKIFIFYLVTLWKLSKSGNVVLDERAILSNEVIHRLISFEDLWDSLTQRPSDKQLSAKEFTQIISLISDFSFQTEASRLMQKGIFQIPDVSKLKQQDKIKFEEQYIEAILGISKFNSSSEESEGIGVTTATAVSNLLRVQLKDQALSIVDRVFEKATSESDIIAKVSICANTVRVLCENLLYKQAATLVEKARKYLLDDEVLKIPHLFIQAWMEVGNVLRYIHQREGALEAYKVIQRFIDTFSIEGQILENTILTLKRNLGIIHRELGNYQLALRNLKEASDLSPKDSGILHNLAILYSDLNRFEDVIQCMDHALEIDFGAVHAIAQSRYLLSRGQAKLELGKIELGLDDLRKAYQVVPSDNLLFRAVIAAASLSFYPQSSVHKRFVNECQEFVNQIITSGELTDETVGAPYLYASLCKRLLRDGEVIKANEIFSKLWERIESGGVRYGWEAAYLRGWLLYAQHKDERCWPYFIEAEEKIDESVPVDSNVQFAPFWIQSKSEFQFLLAEVALDLVERGTIDSDELLGVYEFMNGREISARILDENAAEMNDSASILDRCASHKRAQELNLIVFFFLETENKVHLAYLNARDKTVCLLDKPKIEISYLKSLKSNLKKAFKNANPADLSRFDKKLAEWEQLSSLLGNVVSPHLKPDAHICFLPGRSFSNLPLHLLTMPDGRCLIEWNTVSFAPNFTVMLETRTVVANDKKNVAAIVTVTKATDSPEFKQNIHMTSQSLKAMWEPDKTVIWLREKQADLDAVKKNMGKVNEVIFLCHGTTAGQDQGNGIVIATESLLPPSILSAREIPNHRQFILSWENIEQSPTIFFSTACSSGFTELARGGVRFGLEQTLFSSGTAYIISPLWDVDQESSLFWVEAFYRGRQLEDSYSIQSAYRQACEETRQRYPHFYFWGSFMMNGTL